MPTRVFGLDPLTDIISSIKYSNGEVLIPTIFFGFFIFGAASIIKGGKFRRYYIIGIVCLLLLSSQLALTIFPFVHAHRYSGEADVHQNETEVRLIDENRNEIYSDERATLPFRDNRGEAGLGHHFIHQWNDNQRITYGEQLLLDHQEHRQQLKSNILWWRHPPPSASNYWDDSTLSEYGEFIGIRVYYVNTTYEDSNHKLADREYTCRVEIYPKNNEVIEGCSDV